MAGPRIYFTPATTLLNINLKLWPLVELTGGFRSDVSQRVGVGGKSVAVIHDTWLEYTVQFVPFTDPWAVDTVGVGNHGYLWQRLHSWISHTQRGGLFDLRVDDDQVADEVLTNAEAEGATVIEVADTTDMAADDYLYFEDAEDPTKREYVIVDSVDTGTQLTLKSGTAYAYAAGSIVRARELFLNCIRLRPERSPLLERRAGRGLAWDLRFAFRTTAG